MNFGKKLQYLRKQKGISQEQLASQLTVSRQAISKWELNSSLPDTENIIQLSKLFSVSTDYLLNDDIESDSNIPAVKENTSKLESKFNNTLKLIIGAICTSIGLLGNITVFILSTMIQVPIIKKRILPDGSIEYYGGGNVLGYSFKDFIVEYRLQALFVIFIVLTVIGIVFIVNYKIKQNTSHIK